MVADDHQGRGISSLILERLAGLAAGSGYVGFEADVLYENAKMTNVFRDSGFETRRALEGGIIHVQFPLSPAQTQRERAEIRERVAATNSLIPLLKPGTVAVVGASQNPASLGNAIFRHILRGHFKGAVYPVNLKARAVEGVRAYPSLASLPEAPDLVILAVPAAKVIPLAEGGPRQGGAGTAGHRRRIRRGGAGGRPAPGRAGGIGAQPRRQTGGSQLPGASEHERSRAAERQPGDGHAAPGARGVLQPFRCARCGHPPVRG